jgi:GH35 family endo-1,4-beta-xylanase
VEGIEKMKMNFYQGYLQQTTVPLIFKLDYVTIIALLIWTISLIPVDTYAQPLAKDQNKFLGCSMRSVRTGFSKYWNQVTPEDAGKWGSVEGVQDGYNWTPLDNIYNYAISNNFPYKHHTLIWGTQYPDWITALDSAEQRAEVEEWISLVGQRYPDMDFVDVVNEPFTTPVPFMNALGGRGATGWDWVITAFEWARQYCDSGTKLLLNEYNILQSNSVTDNYIALIDTLKGRGLIDGIGIQGHYFEFKSYQGGVPSYSYPVSTLKYNLDRLAAVGLPIYITEFDINEADNNVQLQNYQIYFPLFWEHPAVQGITLWGYVQYDIWQGNAYLVTERGAERPAIKWLRTYILSPLPPVPVSPVAAVDVPLNPVLIWQHSDSATTYNIQVATTSAFSVMVVDSSITDTLLQLDSLAANTKFYWRVSATNDHGTGSYSVTANFKTMIQTSVPGEVTGIPAEFKLYQNYPNPFNPITTIAYSLPRGVYVTLKVYTAQGQELATLVDQEVSAGTHRVSWDALTVSSGVYFYKISAGIYQQTNKMVILK